MKAQLEIAILAYNRPDELLRALESLSQCNDARVVVSVYEDCSPSQDRICEVVEAFSDSMPVSFFPAPSNLGYDRNLRRAVLSGESDYVLLLSDDDYIDPAFLPCFIDHLFANEPDVVLSTFKKRGQLYRRGDHYAGEYSHHVLYDSVLFSGICFRRDALALSEQEWQCLSTSIYSQVYLAARTWSTGSGYFDKPLIIAGEDGANFFGHNESASDQADLVDRSTPMANLSYQVRFQKVALLVLQGAHPAIEKSYIRSFSVRLVAHFIRVRSVVTLSQYLFAVKSLRAFGLVFNTVAYVPIYLLALFPSRLTAFISEKLIPKLRRSGG